MAGLFAPWFLVVALSAAPDTPQAVLERAIAAAGGETQLRKLAQSQYRSSVVRHGDGQQHKEELRVLVRLPDCLRMELVDQRQVTTLVLRGNEGWVHADGEYGTMRDRTFQAVQDDLHGLKIQCLLEARNPRYKLHVLPPKRVEGVAATGILVSGDGVPDVSLYFDQGSGLLVKLEMRVRDMLLGHSIFQEIFFKGYETVDGVKFPMQMTIYHDYSKYRDVQVKDVKFLEKIRDSEFIRPG